MERESEGKGIPVMFMVKGLLITYILTALLLLLLAFMLYQLGLSENVVSAAIIAIYVISTFFAGFLTGKKMQNRKFLWGLLMGSAYFVILLIVSLLVNRTIGGVGGTMGTTFVLCAGGGMLGGMLS